MSSAQVDQLFNHLSRQLVQVRSSVSEALQSRYDYYTASPSQLSAQVVDDVARQLTALTAVINYTDKVRNLCAHRQSSPVICRLPLQNGGGVKL